MPTRRGYRRSNTPAKPSAAGTAVRNFGEAVANATSKVVNKAKPVIKGGLESYLKGTQKAADYIESKIPEKMKSVKPPVRVRGGLRRRR